ncbi:MAG: class I SAM-dependent methyltransferase [Actinomycetota bacterium]
MASGEPRVHRTAATGFVDGDRYERGRPDYPAGTLDALGITKGTAVVDLGCGTGKFTRLLASRGAKVIGVEPLPAMLTTFRDRCPAVPVVGGVAEALPLAGGRSDVVTCASAFHWFDHDRALPEVHRVLRPGGSLGIIWNRRDEIGGWPAEFWAITEAYRRGTPGYRMPAWRDALTSSPLYGDITEHWFDHVQRADIDGLLARVASVSFIEILPAAERAAVLDRARQFLLSHPDTKDRDVFELPYRTVVYVAPRL